jgi:hypothetical protein
MEPGGPALVLRAARSSEEIGFLLAGAFQVNFPNVELTVIQGRYPHQPRILRHCIIRRAVEVGVIMEA